MLIINLYHAISQFIFYSSNLCLNTSFKSHKQKAFNPIHIITSFELRFWTATVVHIKLYFHQNLQIIMQLVRWNESSFAISQKKYPSRSFQSTILHNCIFMQDKIPPLNNFICMLILSDEFSAFRVLYWRMFQNRLHHRMKQII